MAQLRDTVVAGSLRATDTLFSTTAQFQILRVPTSSNGTTFGPGSNNNLLKSNGTSVYWTTLVSSDIPTISITDKTSGTLPVTRGGTGVTAIANIQAGKDGDGKTISSTYLKLSGGTMTGKLTFNKVQSAIAYTGTKATYDMIKFIDNTGDNYGNGIYIGGGGATIIGGGESADAAAGQVSGGNEILYLCNDGDVNVFTNMQDGWASRKTFTFGLNGTLTASTFAGNLTGNVTGNVTGSSGSCTGNAATATKFASSQSITLTGDTTGTVSSQAGWSISTTTNLHLTSYSFTATKPLSKYVTFDQSNPSGGPKDKAWLNGFISSYNNYLASYIVNEHRTNEWWVGYGEYSNSTNTAPAPTWVKLLHSGNYTNYTVTKTGSGASGTWGISISGNAATATKATQDGSGNTITSTYLKLSGGTMTGPLIIKSKITLQNGYIMGYDTDFDELKHAIWLGNTDTDSMEFFSSGGTFTFYENQGNMDQLIFQIKNGVSSFPLPVNNGGTGATSAAGARTNLGITPANIGALAAPTAVMLGGSEYAAALPTGQFELGILVGQFRDPGDSSHNGYCIVFVYNGTAYMSKKFGLDSTTSVSYSSGTLTVNTSVGYMNYAFIKLM